ncbi:MAG: aldehyde dehydrogenase [Bacteroidetes bacterium]|nr:aldehyde dehydrogenase [Bacteroidota bacterium]
MFKIKNYINGKLIPPASGNYLTHVNPATGELENELPASDSRDVQLAVEAGERAFPEWSSLTPEKRHSILMRIADHIERDSDSFAKAESVDTGKPLTLAKRVDVPRAAANFRFFAAASLHFSSESHEMAGRAINYTLRHPLGIAGCISPWNLPLYLLTWKIAPALATGNCIIAKPSEITPMTAYMLSGVCINSGLPEGVLNIIHGTGGATGNAIVLHPSVKAISFTGSSATGARIAAAAAPLFKKLSLEMGGKNPVIIFADCSYDEMLEKTIESSFQNQGQICLCGSRILVEKKIYNKFKKDFVARIESLVPGDPLSERTRIGAVVSHRHFEKILSYIDLAKKEGGKIICGGKQKILSGRCRNGWFIEPTLIEGVSRNCRTNQEEIFGPVVTISPFSGEEEAVQMANGTPYGLAAMIWTQNLSRAHILASKIQAGIIWINTWMLRDLRTPFGGMKNSGLGREGGMEALRFFTEPKNVCVNYNG